MAAPANRMTMCDMIADHQETGERPREPAEAVSCVLCQQTTVKPLMNVHWQTKQLIPCSDRFILL